MDFDENDIWYRIGYALERARRAPESLPALETLLSSRDATRSRPAPGKQENTASGRAQNHGDRNMGRDNPGGEEARSASVAGEALVRAVAAGGARSVGGRILGLWPRQRRVGLLALTAAGASGAAAAVLVDLAAPLIRSGPLDVPTAEELAESLLEGAGRGLTYGAVVEPRLPGPAFLLGLVYGTAEYALASWGGLPRLLGSAGPHRKIPLLSDLLEPSADGDRPYLEHLVFGLTLALLYDAVHEKRGTEEEE